MRVYFDTNVLASALGTRGFCAEVLELVVARHDLLLGTPVLAELERVLAERFGLDEATIRRVLASFGRFPPVPAPAEPPAEDVAVLARVSDPEDRPVVAAALAAGADLLVTGDRTLRDELEGSVLTVVGPRECWELLRFGERRGESEVHEPRPAYGDG